MVGTYDDAIDRLLDKSPFIEDTYIRTAPVKGETGFVEDGGGMKDDFAKLRMELVDPEFMEEIAKVLTYGAKKYADDSWKKLENPSKRYIGATMRHLFARLRGEKCDPESGFPHLYHVATNLMFLMYFERKGLYE